ncbi:MAG TPA: helix-turn-helix transcriptional regulator [Ruminococcus sp.]|nr:helix-turn-helix transcriptional regulator [Ruminococcus sp.]
MSIGETVRKVRLFKKISQKELASRLGIAPNTLYRYECGDRSISIEMLNKMAAALEVTADILLVDPECIPERKTKTIRFNEEPDPNAQPLTAEQFPEIIKNVKEQLTEIHNALENSFSKLNLAGKKEVNQYAEYLTTKEEYTKPDEE